MARNRSKGTGRGKALFSFLCVSILIVLTFHAFQGSAQTQTIKMPIKKPEQEKPDKPGIKAPAPPGTAPSASPRDIIPPPAASLNYESEMRRVNRLIQANDRDAAAFFTRGWLHHMAGKFQLAERDYTRAIQINKQYASAYYNRGLVSVTLKRYEQAVKDFSEVIRLQPDAIDAYCNRGNAYLRSGQMNSALQDLNEALKIKPDDPDLFYNRGMVYAAMGEESKASADIRKAARAGHAKAREYLKGARR